MVRRPWSSLVFQFVPDELAFDMFQVVLVTVGGSVVISNLVVGRNHLLAIRSEEVALPFGVILTRFTAMKTD